MKQIILTNLGGPRNTDEVYTFLRDLFTDPYLFDLPLPTFLQTELGKFIAKKRATKIQKVYASLNYGGGSPLYDETLKQAKAIEKELLNQTNEKWEVIIKMACGNPNLRELDFDKLNIGTKTIVLPLYPQFSRSTTLSTIKIFQEHTSICPVTNSKSQCKGTTCSSKCQTSNNISKGWINPFYNHTGFIDAISSLIIDFFDNKLSKNMFIDLDTPPIDDWKDIPILFSAHGIPMRLVKKGDTYPTQIENTKDLITKKLQEKGYRGDTYLSYQSKVGPAKWTEPSTLSKIEELGRTGLKRLAVYPISFVSDHLETLEEIGVELRHHAAKYGIKDYYRIPTPGIYPPFIAFLTRLILDNSQISNE